LRERIEEFLDSFNCHGLYFDYKLFTLFIYAKILTPSKAITSISLSRMLYISGTGADVAGSLNMAF
jgi:hypothetical protein